MPTETEQHGTVEHYDQGCRAPSCVHAHRTRIIDATRATVLDVVTASPATQEGAESA